MKDIFEQNGLELWSGFDTPTPIVEPEKAHHSAPEVASWLRQRGVFGTLTKRAHKVGQAIKKLLVTKMQRKCPCCDEGSFVSTKGYVRPCFRCKGKGVMEESDERRWESSSSAKSSGTTKTNFTSYESMNGSNKWDYNWDAIAS